MELRSKLTLGDKVEQTVLHMILIFCTLSALLPFVLLVMSSFTDEQAIRLAGYNFWPAKWSLYAYEWLFVANLDGIVRAYGLTILVTVIGTTLSMLVAPMLAYALSRRDYKRAILFSFLVFFTIIFNGGMVPSYMMWTTLFGLKNTIFAYLFPNLLFNGFLIMIMKNFFQQNIHPALLESARIDGAGELKIYFRIVMPLSLPILATIGLMVGLAYWNDWVNGLYYITQSKMYTIQVTLNQILLNSQALAAMGSAVPTLPLPSNTVRMAIAVVGTIPILLLYPFFQKYYVKGISLGGVKE